MIKMDIIIINLAWFTVFIYMFSLIERKRNELSVKNEKIDEMGTVNKILKDILEIAFNHKEKSDLKVKQLTNDANSFEALLHSAEGSKIFLERNGYKYSIGVISKQPVQEHQDHGSA